MQKITQTMSKACPLIAALLLISSGLSGFTNADLSTYIQDDAAVARLVSFSFFPGDAAGAVGDFSISLEGLYLTGRGDPDGFTFSDEEQEYWVSRSADGWYAMEVVKRYFSQDLEVWVEGYPVFLLEALEVLDPFLEWDDLILESDGDPALLGSVTVENLSHTPASIFDLDYVGPEGLDPISGTSPVRPVHSLKVADGENGLKIPVDIPGTASAGATGGGGSPPEADPACSGLFTPLF